jgi:hypothetical protein
MTNDPWKDLVAPSSHTTLSARRVNAETRWNFYWARALDNRCLLVLAYTSSDHRANRTPHLRGVEILFSTDGGDGGQLLTLKLLDAVHKDIFYRLCIDIVAAASNAKSETEAVDLVLARTWRWHHLLRGGGDSRLSPEEQKGLIGELLFLEEFLLPVLTARDSVSAWHGPLGAPKDFEIERVSIEAKARRGAATPYVAISSEFQLDTEGTDRLFLYVCELDQAQEASPDGFTLTDVADRLLRTIGLSDPGTADMFESLLSATGLRLEDDYSDNLWLRGSHRVYLVEEAFPRIAPQNFPSGVSNVRYSISLPDCAPFLVTVQFVKDCLLGEQNAH